MNKEKLVKLFNKWIELHPTFELVFKIYSPELAGYSNMKHVVLLHSSETDGQRIIINYSITPSPYFLAHRDVIEYIDRNLLPLFPDTYLTTKILTVKEIQK